MVVSVVAMGGNGFSTGVLPGVVGWIVMITGSETAVAPALVVALAVKLCVPVGNVAVTVKGSPCIIPRKLPSSKNSTMVTVPPRTEALAVMVTVPLLSVALFAGDEIATVGVAACPVTVTVTEDEVAD